MGGGGRNGYGPSPGDRDRAPQVPAAGAARGVAAGAPGPGFRSQHRRGAAGAAGPGLPPAAPPPAAGRESAERRTGTGSGCSLRGARPRRHAAVPAAAGPGRAGARSAINGWTGPASAALLPPAAMGSEAAALLEAAAFAAEKHKGQRRKDPEGTPFINHPIGAEPLRHPHPRPPLGEPRHPRAGTGAPCAPGDPSSDPQRRRIPGAPSSPGALPAPGGPRAPPPASERCPPPGAPILPRSPPLRPLERARSPLLCPVPAARPGWEPPGHCPLPGGSPPARSPLPPPPQPRVGLRAPPLLLPFPGTVPTGAGAPAVPPPHSPFCAAGVARILAQEAGVTDTVVLQAALLHDTVEDTDTTFAELEARFGAAVRRVVEEVTDDKALPKAERKRLQVERAGGCSPRAKLVKLADKLHNLRDLNRCTPTGTARTGGRHPTSPPRHGGAARGRALLPPPRRGTDEPSVPAGPLRGGTEGGNRRVGRGRPRRRSGAAVPAGARGAASRRGGAGHRRGRSARRRPGPGPGLPEGGRAGSGRCGGASRRWPAPPAARRDAARPRRVDAGARAGVLPVGGAGGGRSARDEPPAGGGAAAALRGAWPGPEPGPGTGSVTGGGGIGGGRAVANKRAQS
uniref:Guanosine-3',5'-bis(diphosphate) 3'-pyrophosphohydrolase MESH1 n=1 Tax=Calidris pygmaea TaxID=425635 RepID=A0A8C3JR87_9CHAR